MNCGLTLCAGGLLLVALPLCGADQAAVSIWKPEGTLGIAWAAQGQNRSIKSGVEMTGTQAAIIINCLAGPDGNMGMEGKLSWPGLRVIPGRTNGYLYRVWRDADFLYGPRKGVQKVLPYLAVNGTRIDREQALDLRHDGTFTVKTVAGDVRIERTIFPCRDQPAIVFNHTITNTGSKALTLTVAPTGFQESEDAFRLAMWMDKTGDLPLAPGASVRFTAAITARLAEAPELVLDGAREESVRRELVAEATGRLVLETPDPLIDRTMQMAKIRIAETVVRVAGQPIPCSGGSRYTGVAWANDQGEYTAPVVPFLGLDAVNEAHLAAFRLFATHQTADHQSLPNLVIGGGEGSLSLGDRGDAAMLAYGAAWYALARGDRAVAGDLWPFIAWNLEHCRRRLDATGVVASELDESALRLPAGTNLHTSVLTYEALRLAAILAKDLGRSEAADYDQRAAALRKAIDARFGSKVEGFDTYRCSDRLPNLQAWIGSPLAAGILDRKAGTLAALASTKLQRTQGMVVASDRTDAFEKHLLYALRGMFVAGEPDAALARLRSYITGQLLGSHAPYPVEGTQVGFQEQLSGEAALYVRIATEGLFSIRPAGLRSFTCSPSMPSGWDRMALRQTHAFGATWDLEVVRDDKDLVLTLSSGTTRRVERIAPGTTVRFDLP